MRIKRNKETCIKYAGLQLSLQQGWATINLELVWSFGLQLKRSNNYIAKQALYSEPTRPWKKRVTEERLDKKSSGK